MAVPWAVLTVTGPLGESASALAGRATPMTRRRPPDKRRERVEELAEEAKAENPDATTRRESLELELMHEGRSEEGESVEITDQAATGES
jgi:hypothetical protein